MISVIICTRNRSNKIIDALDSVAACKPDELIVVDNGSSDDTNAVVRAWIERASLPTQLVVEPKPGLSNARNTGLRHASGDIIAFTDDDCHLAPDYIDALKRLHGTSDAPRIIGGRVDLGDPTDAPITIKTDAERIDLDALTPVNGFVHGCNMSMTKAVVDRVGDFDVRFGAGAPLKAGEDTDYVIRAFCAGIPVQYEPSLRVLHFHGRKDHSEIRGLMHGYCVAAGALCAKHRRSFLFRHFYWDVKNAVKERFGGRLYDPANGISYGFVVRASIAGFIKYLKMK